MAGSYGATESLTATSTAPPADATRRNGGKDGSPEANSFSDLSQSASQSLHCTTVNADSFFDFVSVCHRRDAGELTAIVFPFFPPPSSAINGFCLLL